jgi:uncharacterized membrane protein YkoI
MKSIKTKWVVPLAALVLTLTIGGAAFAATGSSTDTTAAGTATTAGSTAPAGAEQRWGQQRTDETLLTGDVLAKVQAAALAKIGSDATVVRAETDADGNAKYEVHAVKADGTRVVVYVDESYNVVSVQTCTGPEGRGGMMGGRSDEVALTGDTLAKVQAAALAEAGAGSTLMRAETDADGNAKYEAHVVKADGTHVIVYLDESFKVVKTETGGMGRQGMGGRGEGGRGGGCGRGTPTTGGASTTAGTITNN